MVTLSQKQTRGWDKAWLAKCMSHKHRDINSITPNPYKISRQDRNIAVPVGEIAGSLGLAASQPSQTDPGYPN